MAKRKGVLICTPCFGGLAYYTYVGSMMNTTNLCMRNQIPLAAQFIANESLIGRARNRCAHMFLQSQFDKLLFIDADISWTDQDFKRLYESDKLVVGGTYPGKTFPIELMMNSLTEHGHIFDHKVRSTEQLQELGQKYGNEKGEVEVRHIPTGFMMIDRSVFEGLKPHVAKYGSHALGTKEEIEMYDFFPSGADSSNSWFLKSILKNVTEADDFEGVQKALQPLIGAEPQGYESEDWAFCSLVRKHLNCGVWLNTKTVLPHTGTYTFKAGHV